MAGKLVKHVTNNDETIDISELLLETKYHLTLTSFASTIFYVFFLKTVGKTRRCRIFGQLKLLKLHISAREGMQEPMMSTTPPRWCTRVRTTAHVLSRFRRKHRLWIFDNTCLEDVGLRPKRLMFDPFFIFFHILGSFFHMVKKNHISSFGIWRAKN